MDSVVSLLHEAGIEPTITYNRTRIALGTTGHDFCWFYPRRATLRCHCELRLPSDKRDLVLAKLEQAGFDASARRTKIIALSLNAKNLQNQATPLKEALMTAEESSKG
jgi:hypothetical protein